MDLIELINKVPTVAAWHTGLREQAPPAITDRSSWIDKNISDHWCVSGISKTSDRRDT